MNKSELHGARLVIGHPQSGARRLVDFEPLVGAVEGHDINFECSSRRASSPSGWTLRAEMVPTWLGTLVVEHL